MKKEHLNVLVYAATGFFIFIGALAVLVFFITSVNKQFGGNNTAGFQWSLPSFPSIKSNETSPTPISNDSNNEIYYQNNTTNNVVKETPAAKVNPYQAIDKNSKTVYPLDYYPYDDASESQ